MSDFSNIGGEKSPQTPPGSPPNIVVDAFKFNEDSLWGAAINGNIDRVREILSDSEGMAQIHQTNKYGYTPLQALIPGSTEILQILLESGANPNVQDPPLEDTRRRTPLHNAIHHGNEENAIMLIQYGADVTTQDARDTTPLHLAAERSSIQVLSAMDGTRQLQPHHYQARNDEGMSPLDIAQQRQTNDRQEIIDFIQAHALCVERTVTSDGGLLNIAGTEVKLIVPAGAFKEDRSECLIRLRIIPPGRHDEASTSFCSNSSTVVELSPNNLTLKLPVQMKIPHCLQLKKGTQKKVKIFVSHHEGDAQPRWEEVFDYRYILDDKECTIWMKRFCWTKYEIDDEIVEAKRIKVYTAAKPISVPDDIAEIQVGYHLDLPGAGEVLRENPSFIVDQRMPYLFLREGKHPLKVFLSTILPTTWTYSPPEDNPQEIPFRTVASSVEYSCPFTLQHDTDTTKVPTCIFKASQNGNDLNLRIRPKSQPKSTNQAGQQVTKEDLMTDPIQRLLKELGESWKYVGRNLGLQNTVLDDIGKDYTEAQDQSYHMLKAWIQHNGRNATQSNLIQALLKADRKDLADKVEDWKGLAKDEEEIQDPTSSSLTGRSTESSEYSQSQDTLKRRSSSSGIAVPEKKAKSQPKSTNQAGQQVTEEDLMTDPIQHLLKELGKSWKHVGRYLGLHNTVLDDIQKNYTEAQDQSYHMLQAWIQHNGRDATHSCLIQPLLKSGRKDLADYVKDWKVQPGPAQ